MKKKHETQKNALSPSLALPLYLFHSSLSLSHTHARLLTVIIVSSIKQSTRSECCDKHAKVCVIFTVLPALAFVRR